mgnify:FL=1
MISKNKPKAPIINADGNIFNLIGISSRALKRAGYQEQAKEMSERVMNTENYDEALSVLLEYIEPVDQYGKAFDDTDTYDEKINF